MVDASVPEPPRHGGESFGPVRHVILTAAHLESPEAVLARALAVWPAPAMVVSALLDIERRSAATRRDRLIPDLYGLLGVTPQSVASCLGLLRPMIHYFNHRLDVYHDGTRAVVCEVLIALGYPAAVQCAAGQEFLARETDSEDESGRFDGASAFCAFLCGSFGDDEMPDYLRAV